MDDIAELRQYIDDQLRLFYQGAAAEERQSRFNEIRIGLEHYDRQMRRVMERLRGSGA